MLGAIFLKEMFGKTELISMVTCFGGVIFIMKPSFLFGSGDVASDEGFDLLKITVFFGTPFLLAVIILILRYIMRFLTADIVTFYFSFMGVLFGAVLSFSLDS